MRAVTELKRFGVGGRNLRVFRTSADREAALLEQILAPALRSRNPERRKEAVEALENLAAIAVAPQAPAADPRPAQARRAERACASSDHIRDIPDFPKPGIVFKDITPLFLDAAALRPCDRPARDLRPRARGRLRDLGRGARLRARRRRSPPRRAPASSSRASPGKLPRETASVEYELEYGVDALEVHSDAIAAARACSCTTTCSPPAAPPARSAAWWSRPAASSPAARS